MATPDRISKYRVVRRLGSGAFATVWLAYDEGLDAEVAIKTLAENWSFDDDVRRRFLEEARILWRARHDRVVRVHLVDELDDGRPYFVMDYADRGTLHDRIQSRFRADRQFSIEEAVELASELSECLDVIHALGVVHRDLKPSNVLFRSASGGAEQMVLADFGLARRLAAASGHTVMAGTPAYMAPEQADPERASAVDERADLFAANAILYEILTGRPPFDRHTLEAVRSTTQQLVPADRHRADVPRALAEAITRGLAPEPLDRHPSATMWRAAIGAAAADKPQEPAEETDRSLAARVRSLASRFADDPRLSSVLDGVSERAARPAGVLVVSDPLQMAEDLADSLEGLRGVEARPAPPTVAPVAGRDDAVVILVPPELGPAHSVLEAVKQSIAGTAAGPVVALGVVLGELDDDAEDIALQLARDTSVRSFLLTVVAVDWDRKTLPPGPGSTDWGSRVLDQAYASVPGPTPRLAIADLRGLVAHLVALRHDALRADAALALVRDRLNEAPVRGHEVLADAIEELELDAPELGELSVLRADVAGRITLPVSAEGPLRRVLLESDPAARLGLVATATVDDMRREAIAGAERWRTAADRAPLDARRHLLTVARAFDYLWAAAAKPGTN